MSGPLGSQQWMYASGGFYPYSIDQSVHGDDSSYLYRKNVATVTDGKKFTWSGWVKRTKLGSNETFFGFGADSSEVSGGDYGYFQFTSSDNLRFFEYINTGAQENYYLTTQVFRDTSTWYHIMAVVDTTLGTATDRSKIYVNGERITSFSTSSPNYAQNATASYNRGSVSANGTRQGILTGFDTALGAFYPSPDYLSEVHFIDGQALDPTSFGETINGIWVPKEYAGTYGNNGWYLSFADSGAIGDDLSGNTNDFTVSGIAASDVVPDSPTNNWATNNGAMRANITQSEGNLKMVGVGTNYDNMGSTFTFDVEDADGWYWEYRSIGNDNDTTIGISTPQNVEFNQSDATNPFSNTTACVSYNGVGTKKVAGTNSAYGDSWTAGDVIGIAVKSGAVYFYKNGTIQNSGTAAATGLTGDYVAAYAINGTQSGTANYGQDSTFAGATTAGGNTDANGYGDFKYSVPSGYKALCSANLPEPAIGPNSDTTSDQHFNTVLYTGNASNDVTASNTFASDFVWLKQRSGADNHYLQDIVRGFGASKSLTSNSTGYEGYNGGSPATQNIITTSSSIQFQGADFATNGATYVAWTWKANSTAVSNSDGSITSSVSANQDAGFSVVSYTGVNTTSGQTSTIGHGLSSAPELIICKRRNAGYSWSVGSTAIGNFTTSSVFSLDSTGAPAATWADEWGANPTSTVFTTGYSNRTNISGGTFIAYCFHSVEGFSKFGKYVGNGSADGTFVYTGFRPAFVMVKNIDVSSHHWSMYDNTRSPYNVVDKQFYANLSNAEATGDRVDFLSNGFKARFNTWDINPSGVTHIYIAFAEAPFKYANAR